MCLQSRVSDYGEEDAEEGPYPGSQRGSSAKAQAPALHTTQPSPTRELSSSLGFRKCGFGHRRMPWDTGVGTQEAEGGLGLQKALRSSRGPQAKLILLGVLRPREPRKGKKQCDSQALPLLAISGVAVPAAQGRVPRHTPSHLEPSQVQVSRGMSELGSALPALSGPRSHLPGPLFLPGGASPGPSSLSPATRR